MSSSITGTLTSSMSSVGLKSSLLLSSEATSNRCGLARFGSFATSMRLHGRDNGCNVRSPEPSEESLLGQTPRLQSHPNILVCSLQSLHFDVQSRSWLGFEASCTWSSPLQFLRWSQFVCLCGHAGRRMPWWARSFLVAQSRQLVLGL